METFLEELASEMAASFGNQLEELVFVFPNKRTGLFFRQHLASRINKPAWSPDILPMEDFIAIADHGEVLPPKSTWFEPRMKNGLLVQDIKQH